MGPSSHPARHRWLHGTWLLLALIVAAPAGAQQVTRIDRERARIMLEQVREDLERHFYDSTFKGVDLPASVAAARQRIEGAGSLDEMFATIAALVMMLDDSHTFFLPPGRTARIDYGWEMQMIGDTCFVTHVDRDSDAARQGVKPGHVVRSVNGNVPTRATLWKLVYVYHLLRPQRGLRVVMQPPGDQPRQLDLAAEVREGKRIVDLTGSDGGTDIWRLILDHDRYAKERRSVYAELGGGVLLWKLQEFDTRLVRHGLAETDEDSTLILDLRGNPGGTVKALQAMIGGLFAEDVEIGTLHDREGITPLTARGRGKEAFTGRLIVLVDAHSGSAAEVLARTVQITGRGTVIGDRTAGSVMQSRTHSHQIGAERAVFYAVSVTDADVVLRDGGRLEGRGVTPDIVLLPTGADLAAGRDPVLARAAELAGIALDPRDAAALVRTREP